MKTLTVISVIALPMTVITSFFGMNFDAIPGLHSPLGFWLTLIGMLAVVAGLLFWFWRKRWI
jgi:magnesium transporter